MNIAYISDEPRLDAVNLQFVETARRLKPDFEFKFFFLSDKSCKDNNIIKLIEEIECEYIVHDVDCGCQSKYNEANKYFTSKFEEFKIDILQTGFCLKYLDCSISESYKSYGIFFKNGQEQIWNTIPGNMNVIKQFNNLIITYDVLDYYDKMNYNFTNEIILSNTINASRFIDKNFNEIEIQNHMQSYRTLYSK